MSIEIPNEIPNEILNISISNDLIECPVCFENIVDYEGILIMDCCNKKIHLKCLIEWYTYYPKKNICFMCNQENNFCKDLVYHNTPTDKSNVQDQDYYINLDRVNSGMIRENNILFSDRENEILIPNNENYISYALITIIIIIIIIIIVKNT